MLIATNVVSVVKSLADTDKAAKQLQQSRLEELLNRERLMPCINAYDKLLNELKTQGVKEPEIDGLSYLTTIFRSTFPEVLAQIKAKGKVGIAAQNAVKRSAGTNYQGLCEYALLRWLQTTNLPVAIGTNAPAEMRDELTIHGFDADSGTFEVEPDIDMSLWVPNDDPKSPIIFISAKTSLVDRAGQAARWKLYLDMHQTSCAHVGSVLDCPINRTKIKLKTKRQIIHCIVTANIYKIDTTQPQGELESGQCRNNTYMFKYKYTTRNDTNEARPTSWTSFSKMPRLAGTILGLYVNHQYHMQHSIPVVSATPALSL